MQFVAGRGTRPLRRDRYADERPADLRTPAIQEYPCTSHSPQRPSSPSPPDQPGVHPPREQGARQRSVANPWDDERQAGPSCSLPAQPVHTRRAARDGRDLDWCIRAGSRYDALLSNGSDTGDRPPDLKAPPNVRNPFPVYAWLRDREPVHWSSTLNGWVVTRFADVLEIFN